MAKYQNYQKANMAPAGVSNGPSDGKVYCGGCGAKVPAEVLQRVLSRTHNAPTPHVLVGLEQPDDVTVLQQSTDHAVAATVDFFTSFIDDAFLLGRVAALNAMSDMVAKGACPTGVLVIATIPHGPVEKQESFLQEVLEGAQQVFRPEGIPLVGGHTIEGSQAIVGFTILGTVDPAQMPRKSGLDVGDQLVLTKPIGTGVLLAANMQARCRHDWFDSLLQSMLTSNCNAGKCAAELGLKAVTDVTGFGLAGHLLEMLDASGVARRGATTCRRMGKFSGSWQPPM